MTSYLQTIYDGYTRTQGAIFGDANSDLVMAAAYYDMRFGEQAANVTGILNQHPSLIPPPFSRADEVMERIDAGLRAVIDREASARGGQFSFNDLRAFVRDYQVAQAAGPVQRAAAEAAETETTLASLEGQEADFKFGDRANAGAAEIDPDEIQRA